MSNIANRASLDTHIDAKEFGVAKPPVAERAVAGAYLAAVGIATICWLYVIVRAAIAVINWMIFS